ncbi:DNA-binding transcriptional regulator DsdC [Curvivirga sp.]|uniref:DNA-binding transcriptional regulator DsdC n=1 Tax=Curvivirga sp. TaxID=2856848 RepID=UPI003B593814
MNRINSKFSTLNASTLSGLHCFTTAARLLSFTKTAEELNLTQSAISHRIKKLEEQVGFKLFLRFNRRLQLTDDGQQLLKIVDGTFVSLENALRDMQNQEASGQLTLSCPPSFALNWLTPKLGDFQQKFPNLRLHLETNIRLLDFYRESVDIAIYYGRGEYPNLHSSILMGETLLPVCSPEYAAERGLQDTPGNLKGCFFLHDADAWPEAGPYSEWQAWCDTFNQTGLDLSHGYTFKRSDLAISTAIHGRGVAIGRLNLLQDKLRSGELVAPFDMQMPAREQYHIVCHADRFDQPLIRIMTNWLQGYAVK